jgi:hypothetical protein
MFDRGMNFADPAHNSKDLARSRPLAAQSAATHRDRLPG